MASIGMKTSRTPIAGSRPKGPEAPPWEEERDRLEKAFIAKQRSRRLFGRKKGIHDVARTALRLQAALHYAYYLLETEEVRHAIRMIVTTPTENLRSVPAVHSETIASFRDWFALKHDQLGALHALRRSEQLAGEIVLGRIAALESAEARAFLLESRHIVEEVSPR